MVKKIPDNNAKKQATLLGLSTIDVDTNFVANMILEQYQTMMPKKQATLLGLSTIDVDTNFVANMILEQVEGKSGKINYERIISEIVDHIMTFCIGCKAASLKPTKKASKR